MSLVNMRTVLKKAQEENYAVPAFNVCNLEYVNVVIKTAEEMRAPVIISLHPVEIEYAGLEEITQLIKYKAQKAVVPVVLHLDHGDGLQRVLQCIQNGFTSVMFDGSKFTYEENIRQTKEIVKVAHLLNIDVEAELGLVGGAEGDQYVHINGLEEDELTKPEEVVDFVEKTNIDSLAVAIGTAHGLYRGEPKIDLERLKAIQEKATIPLVLHGGSGTPTKVLKKAIECGICKINIASEFKYAYHKGILDAIKADINEYEPRVIFDNAQRNAQKLLREKFELFGAVGKA